MALRAELDVRGIYKSFRDNGGLTGPVLDGITFSLSAGEVTSLLGASGCGKTTLLRILAGFDSPDSGCVESSIKLPGPQIGFVRQGERLLPWRTLLENVSLGLELIGESKQHARQAARHALSNIGLADYFDWFPRQISGGMTQRVLLARTLAAEPSILLLDEPLGQLDILARRELASIIRRYVQSKNASALIVTHSVEEAVFISDSVLTLSQRPSRIKAQFNLSDDVDPLNGETSMKRTLAFAPIQEGLLNALNKGPA